MDLNSTYFGRFFVSNFALITICVVMMIIAIQRFKQHQRISIYTILLLSNVLLLAVATALEEYFKTIYVIGDEGIYYLALVCGILGYTLRPACIYFVIMMGNRVVPKKYVWITLVPLIINAMIFLCSFIPGTEDIIFGYGKNDVGLSWTAGPLHYSAHVISALYLAFLIFVVFMNLKAKHLGHGLMLLTCTLFVIAAVVIEWEFNNNNTINILNVTIAISAMVYYLYLYIERTQTDGLTGLFNREAFYQDKLKMASGVTGIIQFDMDGLKYINDNYGHSEGDTALKAIADAIAVSIKKNMYAYRLGGDEFIVIVTGNEENDIPEVVSLFKETLSKTKYHCSVGFSYRQGRDTSLNALIKEAEQAMYQAKEDFYKNAKFERRKAEKI
ncbi:MAG: diguanylate cyclase [Bacilli bacterium]|nr:diguanylate cyclase [Bacilli bacterium]